MSGEQSPFDRLVTEAYLSAYTSGGLSASQSSAVATMPRQLASTAMGGLSSGMTIAALVVCDKAGTYSALRFCTGATAPVLTDLRAGVWNADTGIMMVQSDNYSSLVTSSNSVYEIPLQGTLDLTVGQKMYLGISVVGSVPGTYLGVAGVASLNSVPPQLTKVQTGWAGGQVPALSSTSSNGILWAELI